MINAKQELLNIIKQKAKIKCASIYCKNNKAVLKLNYTNDDYNEFLKSLDFNYDNGDGTQELYGTVWLEDGSWLSRYEYYGCECWEHNVIPVIPFECI